MRGRGRRGVRYCGRRVLACVVLAGAACDPSESAQPNPLPPADETRPVVLFLGTSLTAGYGLPMEDAFPARVQKRIDADGFCYRVVNAGVSGDTSAGGLRRIEWLLRLPIAVLVLELGANDMLRGQDLGNLRRNLQEIIRRARSAHPRLQLLVAGMRALPNLGDDYVSGFEAVFPALAEENDGVLIPFALEGVAGEAALNQADGIHPTAAGHRRIADTIWEALGPVLRSGSCTE